jgi:hypothetical protein
MTKYIYREEKLILVESSKAWRADRTDLEQIYDEAQGHRGHVPYTDNQLHQAAKGASSGVHHHEN